MNNENSCCENLKNCKCSKNSGMTGCGIYGLGLIGSAIYFIQHATTFWLGVLGVLKAIVWPAMIVYKLLDFLKM